MPRYTFKCDACGIKKQAYTSVSKTNIICECGSNMSRLLPTLSGPSQVNETVDKLTNRKWIEGQQQILEDRKDIHYWKNEVPRMVNSGTYSLETMLEMGWVYYNDNKQLHTRTKPLRAN